MKLRSLLSTLLVTIMGCTNAYPAAVIFSGDEVKALKQNMSLNGIAKILSGTDDPTAVAKDAPAGSMYMDVTNGNIFKKNDAGSTTNWTKLATGSVTGLNLVENPDFEAGIAQWTSSGGTFAQETNASDVLFGNASAAWTPSGAQNLISDAVTIPNGLRGQNCLASMTYKGGAADYKMQAYDGTNIISEVDLVVSSVSKKVSLSFICPSSGTVALRLITTGAAAIIRIDDARIGDNTEIGTVAQAEFVGSIQYNGIVSCEWLSTSASYANFSVDSDCSSTTVVGDVSAPATVVPGARILTGLGSGHYKVVVSGFFRTTNSGSGNAQCGWRLTDGTNNTNGNMTRQNASTGEQGLSTIVGYFDYDTGQGDTTIQVQAIRTSGIGSCGITNETASQDMKMSIYKYPNAVSQALSIDEAPFHIDANISGQTADLGTANVATYTGLTAAALTLVKNSGSADVEIACSGTEESSGTTCTADESVGISFVAPRAGKYQACAQFTHIIRLPTTAGDAGIEAAFEIVETPNAAQTISAEGNGRVRHEYRENSTGSNNKSAPFNVCGYFDFASSGKKTLRLFYEQTVFTTALFSTLEIEGNGSGQADIHWIVKPLTGDYPMPVIVDSVVTPGTGGVSSVVSALINCDATPTITRQEGDWVASVAQNATGDCSLTVKSGVFSAAPSCTVSGGAAGIISGVATGTISSTNVQILSETDAGAAVDADMFVICHGPK
ncbi:hypothetical protein GOV11_04155 [Candidatus Woesearchaeota archaeon]|nr:hypothetical protein [Candidatus Woesearchaeota archaeon]